MIPAGRGLSIGLYECAQKRITLQGAIGSRTPSLGVRDSRGWNRHVFHLLNAAQDVVEESALLLREDRSTS